jgi:hypothetical protein
MRNLEAEEAVLIRVECLAKIFNSRKRCREIKDLKYGIRLAYLLYFGHPEAHFGT